MNELHPVFLSLGSNLGDRKANLQTARNGIEQRIGPISRISAIYRTQPWGITDQPEFLNQVLEVQTALSPHTVLDTILDIERQMGRRRIFKWGERLIDIDILFYNDRIIQTENLTIPHPFLHLRNFIMVPMSEIAPDWQHPVLKKTIRELIGESTDELEVIRGD